MIPMLASDLVSSLGIAGAVRRLFDKLNDLVVHQPPSRQRRMPSMGTGIQATVQRALFDVIDQHARAVLFVNMIAGEDHHIFRFVATNDIEVLRHRISRAAIPVFAMYTLLRGR